MTYHQLLSQAEKKARQLGKESSAVKLLMYHFANLSPSELFLKFEEEAQEEHVKPFEEACEKYFYSNIPVQYIIGYVYFYGYQFIVSPSVLIPRYETEELVSNVLVQYDELFGSKKVKVLDIGTGSGCLAISLKKEEDNFEMFASDISLEALEVAQKNATNIGSDVTFKQGDMLKPWFDQKFDIIVSNPPYIPSSESVDAIIFDNEPHVALFGGESGLDFYKQILENAPKILNYPFFIAFEHAYDKKEELHALAHQYLENVEVYTLKDMQEKDRMTFIVSK